MRVQEVDSFGDLCQMLQRVPQRWNSKDAEMEQGAGKPDV